MKKQYKVWSVLIFIILAKLPCAAQDHLVFSRPNSRSGMAILMGERILKEAYARLGIDFEFKELPNVRSLFTANSGDTDGEFLRLAGLEQSYPNLKMISVPIAYVDIVVYTKDKNFAVEGWQSLSPYSIGLERGVILIEEKTRGMNVEAVTTIQQAFLKLNAGRTDIVVDSRSTQCLLKNLNVSGISILEPPLAKLVMYHYLHTRYSALAVKLEEVLIQMEQEGELKALQIKAIKDFLEQCGK